MVGRGARRVRASVGGVDQKGGANSPTSVPPAGGRVLPGADGQVHHGQRAGGQAVRAQARRARGTRRTPGRGPGGTRSGCGPRPGRPPGRRRPRARRPAPSPARPSTALVGVGADPGAQSPAHQAGGLHGAGGRRHQGHPGKDQARQCRAPVRRPPVGPRARRRPAGRGRSAGGPGPVLLRAARRPPWRGAGSTTVGCRMAGGRPSPMVAHGRTRRRRPPGGAVRRRPRVAPRAPGRGSARRRTRGRPRPGAPTRCVSR